jgi:hypothetical protein
MITPVHSADIEVRCQQLDEKSSFWQVCPGVRARTVEMADLAVAALDRFRDSDIRYIDRYRAYIWIQVGPAASRGLQGLWECRGVAIRPSTQRSRQVLLLVYRQR